MASPEVMGKPNAEAVLTDRLRAVQARGQVAESLLGVALDVVEPFASEYLSPEAYRQVTELLRRPVEAATDRALATLLSELLQVVEAGDPLITGRIQTVPRHRL